MQIYACECRNFVIKTLGITTPSDVIWFLLVCKTPSGPVGFRHDPYSVSIITNSSFMLSGRDKKIYDLGLEKCPLEVIEYHINPVVAVVREPDCRLQESFTKLKQYVLQQRVDKLKMRLKGDVRHKQIPLSLYDLMQSQSEWSPESIRFVTEHSQSLMIWRFGAGEFGLHCIVASVEAGLTSEVVMERWSERMSIPILIVDSIGVMPVW